MNALHIIMIILAVVVLWLIFRYWYIVKRCHFVCPECKYAFKPKLSKLIFSMNALNGKVLRCPNCAVSAYMEPEKD